LHLCAINKNQYNENVSTICTYYSLQNQPQ
jgi:hypothetical protein